MTIKEKIKIDFVLKYRDIWRRINFKQKNRGFVNLFCGSMNSTKCFVKQKYTNFSVTNDILQGINYIDHLD